MAYMIGRKYERAVDTRFYHHLIRYVLFKIEAAAYEKKELRSEAINLRIEEVLEDFVPGEGSRNDVSPIFLYP